MIRPSDIRDPNEYRIRIRPRAPGDCSCRIPLHGGRMPCAIASLPHDPYGIGGHCPSRGGYCKGPVK